jgi:hypothetical protein
LKLVEFVSMKTINDLTCLEQTNFDVFSVKVGLGSAARLVLLPSEQITKYLIEPRILETEA